MSLYVTWILSQLLHPDENPQDSPPSECTTSFQSPLQPLEIWARGNGTVHFGLSGHRANPSLFLPHGCVVFLHQEEGWVPAFVHWLLGLNEITIRNKYPLPLIDAVFSPLPKARVFTKLNLWNVYHLVQICRGEEGFQPFPRIFRVSSDEVRINKCSCCLPGPC